MSSDEAREAQFFGPLTIQLVESTEWALTVSRRFNYAIFTVMIWDLILTFPKEVSLIWSSRLGLVKLVFLFNRYASPLVMAVNLWMMSGMATGLTGEVCRGWFSVAFCIQIICTTLVSILISFRLWAWYGMSSASLYILSLVWVSSFSAAFGLMIYYIWGNDWFLHDDILNVCTSIAPNIWVQWLPGNLEHLFYFCFLLIGAMSTPRSAQTPALAVLYRDGILFYLITFMVMFMALMDWAIAPRPWLALTVFSPWIVFQVAISRLLLEFKIPELLDRRRGSGIVSTVTPLREFTKGRPVDTISLEKHIPSLTHKMSNTSRPSFHQADHDQDHLSDIGSSVHVYTRKSDERFWWILGRAHSDTRDIYVDVLAEDEREAIGGVKDSRLGRFDSWLW